MADEKQVSREALALSWLLRHPAPIQPIVGSTKIDRVIAGCAAEHVSLTREEWYTLFCAGRGANMA